jgi:DNA-binding transcriptional MerR regulator
MNTKLYALSEYSIIHQVDPSFIQSLEEEGLINVIEKDKNSYVEEEQLHRLEIFTRWHVQMGINTEGIDAMWNLMDRLKQINTDLHHVRQRLRLYESGEDETQV